jgi:hypothetical protein
MPYFNQYIKIIFVSYFSILILNELLCQSLKFNLLFSEDTTKQVNLIDEYYNLTPKFKVVDKNFVFNTQFDTHINELDDISIIFELTNSKDCVLHWSSTKLNEDTDDFISNFKYLKAVEEPLYFRSYIWNKSKSKLSLINYNSLAYSY